MIDFDVIVAADERGGIGRRGQLPWRIREDLQHFQELTRRVPPNTGPRARNAVIMGRKTWESLPTASRPLPGRLNTVLTASSRLSLPADVLPAASLEAALQQLAPLRAAGQLGTVFVIGGGQVYAEALSSSRCRQVYLTRVRGQFDCDTFLPSLDSRFVATRSAPEREEDSVRFAFEVYERAKGA